MKKILRLHPLLLSAVCAALFLPPAVLTAADSSAIPGKTAALSGMRSVIDLAAAELSGDENIQLVERDSINAVEEEQDLSRINGQELAALFPHTDLFAVVSGGETPAGVVVFNAKTGFLLTSSPFPIHCSIAGAGLFTASELRRAALKLTVEHPSLLSFYSVRQVGLSAPDVQRSGEFLLRLEECLAKSPDIQLLERARLDLVNKERALTDLRFELPASAILLTLEFEPAGNDGAVLTVLLRDASEKILKKLVIPRIFSGGDTGRAAAETADKIRAALTDLSPDIQIDAKREAGLFYDEFLRVLGNTPTNNAGLIRRHMPKLEAALSLDSSKELYRTADIVVHARLIETLPVPDRIPALREQLNRLVRFTSEFRSPAIQQDFPLESALMLWSSSVPMRQAVQNEPPSIQAEYTAFMREAEAAVRAEFIRCFPFDLSDGINSLREMENHLESIHPFDKSWEYYFVSVDEIFRRNAEYLEAMASDAALYLASHPDDKDALTDFIWRHSGRMLETVHGGLLNFKAVFSFAGRASAVCGRLRELGIPPLPRGEAFMRSLVELSGAKSLDDAKSAMFHYFDWQNNVDSGRASMYPELRGFNFCSSSDHLVYTTYGRMFLGLNESSVFPAECLEEWLEQNRGKDAADMERLKRAVFSIPKNLPRSSVSKYAPFVSALRSAFPGHWKDQQLPALYIQMLDDCFKGDMRGMPLSPAEREFFAAANADFEIETKSFCEFPQIFTPEKMIVPRLLAIAESKDEIALFLSQSRILFLNRQSVVTDVLHTGKDIQIGSTSSNRIFLFSRPFAVCETHVAYLDTDDSLRIFDRRTRKWTVIEHFSEAPVRSLLFHKDRLYCLVGGDELMEAVASAGLFSCALDGSGRNVLFSMERAERTNEFEKTWVYGALSGLTAIDDDNLLFLVSRPGQRFTTVWRCSLIDGSFHNTAVSDFEGHGRHPGVLYPDSSAANRFLLCDGSIKWISPEQQSTSMSCNVNNRTEKKRILSFHFWDSIPIPGKDGIGRYFSNFHNLPDFHNAPSIVRIANGHYWSGFQSSACIDIRGAEAKILPLMLPETKWISETDDGVLYFSEYRIFHCRRKNPADRTAPKFVEKQTPDTSKQNNPENHSLLILDGIFSGVDAFTIRENAIEFTHRSGDMPKNLSVNGIPWDNTSKPFVPPFSFKPEHLRVSISGKHPAGVSLAGRGDPNSRILTIRERVGAKEHYTMTMDLNEGKHTVNIPPTGSKIFLLHIMSAGSSTFHFFGDKIYLEHRNGVKPRDVSVNGKKWEDLDRPFQLDFKPDCSKVKFIASASGAARINVDWESPDRASLFIDDEADQYHSSDIELAFP